MNTPLRIIAGPIVRKFSSQQLVLWLVTDQAVEIEPELSSTHLSAPPKWQQQCLSHQVGERAFVHHLIIDFAEPISCGSALDYQLRFATANHNTSLTELLPDICYPGLKKPRVFFQSQIQEVLHGSCRKPHHDETDALIRVEQHIGEAIRDNKLPAAMLIMSGDQVYVDDVAGPFLQAIHQVIAELRLFHEDIPGAVVDDSKALLQHPDNYYRRTELLPLGELDQALQKSFFRGKRKPIFTSVNAKNHLITFSEVMAMYFMVWSPELWQSIEFDKSIVPDKEQPTFVQEQKIIEDFVSTLPKIRRALAHIPVYMIFDDHDITDDWNLTREWEELAYGHPFSKRIIGNALAAYWLCQGIGNNPKAFKDIITFSSSCFTDTGFKQQDDFIARLLNWNQWHYEIDVEPCIVVLDSRTHRWRSEKNAALPSGLLDWERLQDLKQKVTGKEQVIIVSPAPMFGVKIIEAIQKIFTWFGHALTVDAENWMAHEGTAKVLLDIFSDEHTARQFIILSGDVHYSFTYDVRLHFRKNSPKIHQITVSGYKNQFPVGLISKLDKLNRWFYGHTSPLNWFTRRRKMKISTRYPCRKNKDCSLVSKSAVGLLQLNNQRQRPVAKLLLHDGENIEFK